MFFSTVLRRLNGHTTQNMKPGNNLQTIFGNADTFKLAGESNSRPLAAVTAHGAQKPLIAEYYF
mgnify:CR=1 FL=1